MGDRFKTTHWSVVLNARHQRSTVSRQALNTLCETYWSPLYSYVRARGYGAHEAEDLTQEFFTRLLEKKYLKAVSQQKGKFRSFLLASMNNFLANEWDYRNAKKRGGGRTRVPIDFALAERMGPPNASFNLSPERIYERQWALAVLEDVMSKLKHEQCAAGKKKQFDTLRFTLVGEKSATKYLKLAEELDTTESPVKVAVYRLRKRYRELLRHKVAQTVSDDADIDGELQDLFAALRN